MPLHHLHSQIAARVCSDIFILEWRQWWGAARWGADCTSPPSSAAAEYPPGRGATGRCACSGASWGRDAGDHTAEENNLKSASLRTDATGGLHKRARGTRSLPLLPQGVKLTFVAPGNRMGMNLKFLLPFWMNSFWSCIGHRRAKSE